MAKPKVIDPDQGAPDQRAGDGPDGGNRDVPPWAALTDVVQAMAIQRKPHLPCRVTYPDPRGDVIHGIGWGAPVEDGQEFRVLFSDGTWISP